MTKLETDPLRIALGAYQRGDVAACLRTLEETRDAWSERPDGWLIRGVATRALGRTDDAEAAYRQAIALFPAYAEAWQNLGNLYGASGRHAEAVDAYARAASARREPREKAHLLSALAGSAFSAGRVDVALHALEQAVAEDATLGAVHNQHGKVLWELGHTAGAIDAFRRAIECDPQEPLFATNYLLVSQFSEELGESDLASLARATGARIRQQLPDSLVRDYEPVRPAPGERIRIGYVSSDFRATAPGFFIQSIVAGHDRSRFEVFALATGPGTDTVSDRIRECVDHWVDVGSLDVAALTERVRRLRLHVLVDLNGYTGGHRLAMFAARAAALQVTWLGYEGSTQLPNMDVFFGDDHVAPVANEPCYSERVIRLPFDFACYSPPDYAPAVVPAPFLRRGYVTFGSFNKLAKLGPATLDLWARVLDAVEDSRLLVKWRHATHPFARDRIVRALAAKGIAEGRVEFRDASPHAEMLGEYGDVDIALDPLPFSGGATTCDALWMGVPVVTLRGVRFASNHTVSHLHAAGLPELVASRPEDYVSICEHLARDLPALARLRTSLRSQMQHSPLTAAGLFMRPVERHLQAILGVTW
ncbi:MAG: tetratricopeptide repeat protein [Betaproteobacteria bacterium]|nr:tetratricopeptide repeat protein [Betaproteobacteria bacterium]